MSRAAGVLRLEITTQWRYRFTHAAVISGVLWLALLLPLPGELRSVAEPYVVLGDLTIVGFFFIAASVFFEKGERTLHALVASPVRFAEYLSAKLVTLTALSALLAVFVATVTHGADYHLPALLLGAVFGTPLLLLTSFVTSLPFPSVSDWFMPSVVPLTLLNLPILHYSGLVESSWFYLVPTQGPLLMLGAAFHQKSPELWQVGYAVVYPTLFALGLFWLARRVFDRYVVARTGGA
ncbi:fluoroquinolone export ABC transporter permease subunit [Streptoalloteichus hindustanus]|uniref:Fluoroquinolone transport system permease protein n=1 Tax=Streptoalloteichus hindustanus TaxID=2017 RepID=A0A1M5P1H1_STRHI|nr:ABC transporter permease [Streptoalloteichus hindustanus]SHG95650.1 fluoroquinolone transport system permease protein [Streptoalloteichus hindustanus]